VEFLTRAFAVEPGLQVSGDKGQVRHAELWIGDGALMVGSGADREDLWRGRTLCTQVVVDDPDAHHAKAAWAVSLSRQLCVDDGKNEFRGLRDDDVHLA